MEHEPEDELEPEDEGGELGDDLPDIIVSNRDLPAVTEDAIRALVLRNSPPVIFHRGTALVRLSLGERPKITPLGRDMVKHRLARVAHWVKQKKDGAERTSPPPEVVRDLLSYDPMPMPALERVMFAPFFDAEGRLVTEEGYDEESATYVHLDGLQVKKIPEAPTQRHVREARNLITRELFGEFPFTGEAELAHAVALVVLPFVRDMIVGPTPLHLVEAPAPGTGKTLLVQSALAPALGAVGQGSEAQNEEEFRKRITSMLVRSQPVVFLDNQNRRLDSSVLSNVITASDWQDRELHYNRIFDCKVRNIWVVTGNNVAMSTEIARRCVRVRLDAQHETPWDRKGFKHQLPRWALEHRGELASAALTLIQAWIAASRPSGEETLGSFESWAETVGGILAVAGLPGFLTNKHDLIAVSDTERVVHHEFVGRWWETFGDRKVVTDDLWGLIAGLPMVAPGTEQSQRIQLGKVIFEMRDRTYRHRDLLVHVRRAGRVHGRAAWQLEQAQ